MKINFWPKAFIFIMGFFLVGIVGMVWIATHSPPVMVERADEWK